MNEKSVIEALTHVQSALDAVKRLNLPEEPTDLIQALEKAEEELNELLLVNSAGRV
jgi:hypothetical protein